MDVANTGANRTMLLDVEPHASESRPPNQTDSKPRTDMFARLLGLMLSLAGVAIISVVIFLAYELYRDPNLARLPSPAPGQSGIPVTDVGSIFMRLIFQIGLLAIMSVSGSLIANKGIHMFLASFPVRER